MPTTNRKQLEIVCDIDGTLTVEVDFYGDQEIYSRRTPNLNAIKAINNLVDEGYLVTLHTARWEEDRAHTEQWLQKHGVKYTALSMGKPFSTLAFDDRSIPLPLPDLHKYLSYNFHRSCSRYKGNGVGVEESHPCFFCETPLSMTSEECPTCGIIICPNCKSCLCNIPRLSYLTLVRVHEKYCCNLDNFTGEIDLDGFIDNDLIKRCNRILMKCKEYDKKRSVSNE